MAEKTERRQTTLTEAIVLMIIIIGWLIFCIKIGMGSDLAIPMYFSWVIIYLFCKIRGISWPQIQAAMFEGIKNAFGSITILFAVGALIGAWIASGTIPMIIYLGLKVISPKIFLLCALLMCSILSLATGTSYGSAGSGGIAMMAIGNAMGIPAGMTAGAVICGALFGDKISPLSDTTNLCPALVGGDLFKHIRSMLYTTVPSYLLCAILFTVIGLKYGDNNYDPVTIQSYMQGLSDNFNLTWLTLIPMVVVIVLLVAKRPPVPTILIGAILGIVFAMFFQGGNFVDLMNISFNGYKIESGIQLVDKLLNRGGLMSMSKTAYIMIFAVGLGVALEQLGIINVLVDPFIKKIRTIPQLIISTFVVGYGCSAIGCTMVMSHVLMGRIMSPIFKEKGVAPEVLSRTMEDCGTVGCVLLPWHTTPIYFCGVLGVTWAQFIPYAFMCWLTPIMGILCAFTGIGIFMANKNSKKDTEDIEHSMTHAAEKSLA